MEPPNLFPTRLLRSIAVVRGYRLALTLKNVFFVNSYPDQILEPRPDTAVRPASLHHLGEHTDKCAEKHFGPEAGDGGGRGYPPCSSSLLKPELPSSQ